MGMPITVELAEPTHASLLDEVFGYFLAIDQRFSPFKPDSEVALLNEGQLPLSALSRDMREVLDLAERTRQETNGYFDLRRPDGRVDPSGIVKGWAVRNAARLIEAAGPRNFYVEAGGDIQSRGTAPDGQEWRIGIRDPFDQTGIVMAVAPRGRGIATSGTYVRGQHIYNPHRPGHPIQDLVSLTVVGPDALEADRFATAAFAMGEDGIYFIEDYPNLEAYAITPGGIAIQTTGFGAFVIS